MTGRPANPARGEVMMRVDGTPLCLRPSFAALVALEAELGCLFALVDRAAEGQLSLADIAALFDHCSRDGRPAAIDRARIGEALAEQGLIAALPALRTLLGQILQGR